MIYKSLVVLGIVGLSACNSANDVAETSVPIDNQDSIEETGVEEVEVELIQAQEARITVDSSLYGQLTVAASTIELDELQQRHFVSVLAEFKSKFSDTLLLRAFSGENEDLGFCIAPIANQQAGSAYIDFYYGNAVDLTFTDYFVLERQ